MAEEFDREAEKDRLLKALEEALKAAMPEDMLAEKVSGRMTMIAGFFGTTRTTVVAALAMAGMYARVVGLDLAKQHELIDALDKVMEASPLTEEAKAAYAKANQEFHAKEAAALAGGTLDGQIVLPGDGKVH